VRRLRPTLLVACAAVALATLPALPARAASGTDAEARAIEQARAARGRWCPPTGCAGAPGGTLPGLGGFAAATLGALALARRRSS
jgi:MYXO-CTERM domain-containing protein